MGSKICYNVLDGKMQKESRKEVGTISFLEGISGKHLSK